MNCLRNVFLFVSVCSFGNMHCSEEHKMVISSSDSHGARNQSDEIPTLIPLPQPSTLFTKTWYGISKHVAGMSAYAILMELHSNGKLKADFDHNPDEAMNRLNETASERFTKKDLLAADKQAKISLLFTTVHEISTEFALAKALAARYLESQRTAVTTILEKQALEIEPALRAERRSVIKEAKLKYTRELTKELDHARNAASNCRYLHEKAEAQDDFNLQNKSHYVGLATYSALLESIQKTSSSSAATACGSASASIVSRVLTISDSNAADEAAYLKYSTSYDPADLE